MSEYPDLPPSSQDPQPPDHLPQTFDPRRPPSISGDAHTILGSSEATVFAVESRLAGRPDTEENWECRPANELRGARAFARHPHRLASVPGYGPTQGLVFSTLEAARDAAVALRAYALDRHHRVAAVRAIRTKRVVFSTAESRTARPLLGGWVPSAVAGVPELRGGAPDAELVELADRLEAAGLPAMAAELRWRVEVRRELIMSGGG